MRMNKAGAIDEFIRLNQQLHRTGSDDARFVLVDAAYQDPYIVMATMKVADCAARLTGHSLVVLAAANTSAEMTRLIGSFKPRDVITLRVLAWHGFATATSTVGTTARIRSGQQLAALDRWGMPIGEHLYDTLLMRFSQPTLERLTMKQRLSVAAELCILEGARRLVDSNPPALAILPDNVYRAGALFQLLATRRIPMLAGLNLNGLAAHYYRPDGCYMEHCRTPHRSLVSQIATDPELFALAETYLRRRTAGDEAQHDVKRAYDAGSEVLDRRQLCQIMRFSGDKPIAMIAAHVFTDAPHACEGLLFRDYQDWLLSTCRMLSANPSVDFFVKAHPSAELYGEEGLTQRILTAAGVGGYCLQVNVNTSSLFQAVDAVITCGGTAGAEFPCFGVPVLLAAGAPYDQLGFVVRARSLAEYSTELARLHEYGRLSDSQIRDAKAALFAVQMATKIPKSELGLGTQPLMRGTSIDFTAFIEELIDDLRTQRGYQALTDALTRLFAGPDNNLLDPRYASKARSSPSVETFS